MVLGRQGPLAKIINSGVGLTQEYRADRKARKESEAVPLETGESSSHLEPPHSDVEWESEDDEAWAQDLDAAQAEHTLRVQDDNPNESVNDVADDFIRNHAPPPYAQSGNLEPLANPVILPQRRPGMQTRGFVRGYPPILAERGITQDAWLDFLTGFEKAIGKNRWFHVLQLAVFVAGKIRLALQGISLIARAVSTFIHLTLEITRRGYMHTKQNKYLDKMNDEYFKPRGLYAVIIKYKPKKEKKKSSASAASTEEAEEPIETTDIEQNIAEIVEKREGNEGKFWKGLMTGSAGKTTSDEEIPEFAHLVFPQLDALNEEEKKSSIKRKGAFLADYYDRRAQATYAYENPDSKLANVAPRKEFASNYADPAHPQSQADLIGTLSGGKMTSISSKVMDRRRQRRGRLGIVSSELPIDKVRGRKDKRSSMRPMKKLLKQDALYMMVVDLPSQQEMDAVRQAIENLADEP